MSIQTTTVILIFNLVFNQRFQTVLSSTNTVFDNLHYNTEDVNWVEAVNRCHDDTSSLVPLNSDPGSNLKNVATVKRSVHFRPGNKSWIGDYMTYDVIRGQDTIIDIHVHKCVALQINIMEVVPDNLLMYGYNLVTENCTLQYPALCSSDNNTFPQATQSSTSWLDVHNCTLWQPNNNYEIKPVAEGAHFASGKFMSLQENLISKTFWVNLIVRQQFSKLPVVGNILQCGYIDYYSTSVSYTDCSKKKPFICRTDNGVSNNTGLYIGLSVSLVVVAAVSVGVAVFIIRIRHRQGNTSSQDLPRGGKSFTRRKRVENISENGNDNAAFKENNRVTTYHQINADEMKVKSINDEENVESGQRVSDHTYSVVKKKRNEDKPDVIPRVSKTKSVERPGYLSMNGTSSKQSASDVNQDYDFLESTRSSNRSRNGQIERNATNDSIYSSTTPVENDSTYDVTVHRGLSQKRLINEDYDHVMIESTSNTMNRGICESIGENFTSTNKYKGSPMINPNYDKVSIT